MTRSKNTNVCAIIVSALAAMSSTATVPAVAISTLALLTSAAMAQTEIIRVDGDNGSANPANFGDDWGSDAYKYLQDAVDRANVRLNDPQNPPVTVEIWVAATDPGNPYRPDQNAAAPNGTEDAAATFALRDNVRLYGGFLGLDYGGGGETLRSQRDPENNTTVLSGYYDETSNATHVVTAQNVDDSAWINGFTITGGYANATGLFGQTGGGMLVLDSLPVLARCRFVDNRASYRGAGLYFQHDEQSGTMWIMNCEFIENSSDGDRGGGVHYFGGDLVVANCTFFRNEAELAGAGLSVEKPEVLDVLNCTFVENKLTFEGGSLPQVYKGAGMLAANGGTTLVANCIFWNNVKELSGSMTEEDQLAFGITPTVDVTHTCIQNLNLYGGQGFVGNIDQDPQFVNQSGGDLRLNVGSPSVNTGTNAHLPPYAFDIADNPTYTVLPDLDIRDRVLQVIVDMGAYENPCGCLGDLNGDCVVDGADLALLLGAWGPCGDCQNCPEDLDGSCEVDGADLAILLGAWGVCDGSDAEDPGPPPSMQVTTSAEQGNYIPLYAWLVNTGNTELATQLAVDPGLLE